jgi:heme exporter protein C
MQSLKQNARIINGLLGLTFVTMIAAQFLIFVYVPTERTMGVVQRIFYFHVPLGWNAFLAFAVVFVCSILYLRSRDRKWDRLARSSAEIGLIFTTLVLIAGTIWDKPAWGTWWTWDPRLTTTLILWFIYLAYHLVSAYATEESQGARYAAVVGIIGFLDVPIVALAIVLWPTQHPSPVIFEGGLTGSMLLTLIVSIIAFTLLYASLLILRTSLRQDADEIKKLKQYMNERN